MRRSMLRRSILCLALPALILMADHGAAEDVRTIIAGYKAWKPTSEKPIYVPDSAPGNAALCRPMGGTPSAGPHEARYIRVFVSPNGWEAYDKKMPFPEGTVIVKEKCRQETDAQPMELGVMIKHGKSWEYSFIGADGKTVVGERLLNCVKCHARATNDSVFGRAAVEVKPRF